MLCPHTVAFTITPSPQVVGVGQQAVFQCLHPSANIDWIWNGTVLIDANLPDGIATDRTNDENSGRVIAFTLTVDALLKYNETEVTCLATTFDGTTPIPEVTLPVNITIQGETDHSKL